VTVVADDDQAIYRFRGAAIGNILNFRKAYPEAKSIILTQNYRSVQMILDCAYRLIQYNNPHRLEVKEGIDKRLRSVRGAESSRTGSKEEKKGEFKECPLSEYKEVQHLYFETVSDEADKVAEIIRKAVESKRYVYQDFAILVRSNDDAIPFIQALNMKSIPWNFSGTQRLYAREEIKTLIAFLKVITNLYDSLSLYYLASSDIYRLDTLALTQIMNYATRKKRSLYEIFLSLAHIPELQKIDSESKATVEKIVRDIKHYVELSRQQSTGRLLYLFLSETGYLTRLSNSGEVKDEQKIESIARFFEVVKNTELLLREDRVINFINYLDALMDAGDDPATVEINPDLPAVNVLTVHKAKGLEFRVVFLVSLVMYKFPLRNRKQELEIPEELIKDILPERDFHLQEERRLFYVGMTRAKERVFFTSARDYGGKRARKVSQFVLEALDIPPLKKPSSSSALESINRHLPLASSPILKSNSSKKGLNLSYLQIDDYLTCPLKYKYVHILRVPVLPHHSVVYGRAMHLAVAYYYQNKLKGRKISKSELLGYFDSVFISEGFLTREHEELTRAQGRDALSSFFEREEQRNKPPAYVERRFSFLIEKDKISGRWDRIDIEEGKVSIIDFKSSKVEDQREADKKSKESLQLSIYALAYKSSFGKIPEEVGLYFLESGIIGSHSPTEEDLKKTVEKIKEASEGIRRGDFSAKPTYFACQFCAYRGICPEGR